MYKPAVRYYGLFDSDGDFVDGLWSDAQSADYGLMEYENDGVDVRDGVHVAEACECGTTTHPITPGCPGFEE
jgi:hypothetical protein